MLTPFQFGMICQEQHTLFRDLGIQSVAEGDIIQSPSYHVATEVLNFKDHSEFHKGFRSGLAMKTGYFNDWD